MYRSTHKPSAELVGSTIGTFGTTLLPGAGKSTKKPAALFGPQERVLPDPAEFLKRGEKSSVVAARQLVPSKFTYALEARKATVPRHEERPVMGLKTSKNFITANAVEAILQGINTCSINLAQSCRLSFFTFCPRVLK